MSAGAGATPPDLDVVGYVRAFNEGVGTGEWGPFVAYFADDAVMMFEGAALGPVPGKAAIERAYREHPPDDTIALVGAPWTGGEVLVVPYRWAATGTSGTMRFTMARGLIVSLTVTLA